MLDITLPDNDSRPDSPLQMINQKAMPTPTQLSAALTASNALQVLPRHGMWAASGATLYLNQAGHVYSYAGTLII